MDGREPRARWGEARLAFRIIERRAVDLVESGRTVLSVFRELQPHFPGHYSQFAYYVQTSALRTKVRHSAHAPLPAPPTSPQSSRQTGERGPRELVVATPAQFRHRPGSRTLDDLVGT